MGISIYPFVILITFVSVFLDGPPRWYLMISSLCVMAIYLWFRANFLQGLLVEFRAHKVQYTLASVALSMFVCGAQLSLLDWRQCALSKSHIQSCIFWTNRYLFISQSLLCGVEILINSLPLLLVMMARQERYTSTAWISYLMFVPWPQSGD